MISYQPLLYSTIVLYDILVNLLQKNFGKKGLYNFFSTVANTDWYCTKDLTEFSDNTLLAHFPINFPATVYGICFKVQLQNKILAVFFEIYCAPLELMYCMVTT